MFLPHFLPDLLSKRLFLSKGALGQCPLQLVRCSAAFIKMLHRVENAWGVARGRRPPKPIRITVVGNHGKMSELLSLRALAPTFCRSQCRTLPGETATLTATLFDRRITHHIRKATFDRCGKHLGVGLMKLELDCSSLPTATPPAGRRLTKPNPAEHPIRDVS